MVWLYREEFSKEKDIMKVSPSIRKRCAKCKVVKRGRRLYIICENPKQA